MKKNTEVQNKKIRLIGIITVITILGIIIGGIVIKNVGVGQETKSENYFAGANQNSDLIANNIKKGITIGGITGTLDSLDTSDANATPEDIALGKTAYVNGVKITGTRKKTLADITGNETENTETQDSLGNKVVIPAGFKVVNPNDNVEKGIIIEDVSAGDNNTKGSQFVWIPVGKIKTSSGEKTITLGRYDFNTSGNTIQVASNYIEETTQEHGNTIAKNINAFVNSATTNGGYYIGRYEAGDALATSSSRSSSTMDTNPIVCKTGVYPYTWIEQSQAADLCQNMYNSEKYTSDLINSYAWDTAIVFIQECSGDTDYSRQKRLQTTIAKCGESSNGTNKDVKCNIYDMAGCVREWTTETDTTDNDNCVSRGGAYFANFYYTGYRYTASNSYNSGSIAARPTLYF